MILILAAMRTKLLLGLGAVLIAGSMSAKDDPELQTRGHALIERGVKVSNLLDPAVGPIVMKAGSSGGNDEPRVFTYSRSGSKFRIEVGNGGDFLVGDATSYWSDPASKLQFDLLGSAMRIVNYESFLTPALKETVKAIREKKVNGVPVQCVTTESKEVREREVCLDPQTGVPVEMKIITFSAYPLGGPPPRDWNRFDENVIDFKEYESYNGVLYPRLVELKYNGQVWQRRRIDTVTTLGDGDSSKFTPETNFQKWDWCQDMRGPLPKPAIIIRDESVNSAKNVTVRLVISEEGMVVGSEVISEMRKGDGEKLIESLSRQKFTPGMCDGRPVKGNFVFNWKGLP